jgi:hypothetical protein
MFIFMWFGRDGSRKNYVNPEVVYPHPTFTSSGRSEHEWWT